LNQFFDTLAKNSRVFLILLAVLVAIGAVGAVALSRREARAETARVALFGAIRTLDKEMKTVATQMAPPAKVEKLDEKTKEKQDPKAKEAENLEAILFKKLDVDAKFPGGVHGLQAVAAEFQGTRAGYEAQLILANLYFEHGEAAKSVPQYLKAVETAPGTFEKATALEALGYAYENTGKVPEALQTYDRALNLGEVSIRGDVMLAMGRSLEAMNDPNKARSIYDQIQSQLPNTEYAKTAEIYKGRLAQ
jgi:tetratricopeptide (TPR) repeat protein